MASQAALAAALALEMPRGVRLAATVGGFSSWVSLHWEESESLPSPLIGEASPAGFAAQLRGRVATAIRRADSSSSVSTVGLLVRALDSSARDFGSL